MRTHTFAPSYICRLNFRVQIQHLESDRSSHQTGEFLTSGRRRRRTHLVGGVVLPGQERLSQLDAGGEAVVTRVDLGLDALVVVHQQLHRRHVAARRQATAGVTTATPTTRAGM